MMRQASSITYGVRIMSELLDFYDPPPAILAAGSKEGVDLGGNKVLVSVDGAHNFYTEGTIYTEMSWGTFYQELGLDDQIDTFETKDFSSIREDPQALTKTLISSLDHVINSKKLFYGIWDLETDAFLNQNTVIPGLKMEVSMINKLMDAHKTSRDDNLFPDINVGEKGMKKIRLDFQGTKKKRMHFFGSKLEDLADRLRLASGFATGIVCTSRGAANLYMMNDTIVFKENEAPELYVDEENIMIIEMGIQRELLFPISWFRIDLGIKSLETLDLWNEIKEDPGLKEALRRYDEYITSLVYKKYQHIASTEKIGKNLEDDFYNLSPQERRKALSDMAGAIRELTKKYKE